MRRWGVVMILPVAAIVASAIGEPVHAAREGGSPAVVPFGQPRPGSLDDGWRRTADGWEHIADWPIYAASEARMAGFLRESTEPITSVEQFALVPEWRLDFHPAVLALAQIAFLAWLVVRSA